LNQLRLESNFSTNYETFQNEFNTTTFTLIDKYVINGLPHVECDKLYEKLNETKKVFIDILSSYDSDYFKLYKDWLPEDKLLNLSTSDFENPYILLSDIKNEIYNYEIKRVNNSLNKALNEDWGESRNAINKESFLEINGDSPITIINEILNEYDCNGYILDSKIDEFSVGNSIPSEEVRIKLINKSENYKTDFDLLSSGEKILISLALLIYKSNKRKIKPKLILMDEIDSTLHPSMIKKLLKVIKVVFIEKYKISVILATHSSATVALSPDNAIYVIDKSSPLLITKQEKTKALEILSEGFVTLKNETANLSIQYNILQSNLPILFTEGITDKIIIETAWEKLEKDEIPFYIQDCFDAKFLSNFFRRGIDKSCGFFKNYPDRVFMALFDFDSEGFNQWNSVKECSLVETTPEMCLTKKNNILNAYTLLLPVPENLDIRKQVIKNESKTFEDKSLLTIELLFYGCPQCKNYFKKSKSIGSGEVIEFNSSDKIGFATKIKELDTIHFEAFKPLFNKIKEIIRP
jgi:energy-coupling factor transporter ATP-binding protein EcfA2